MSIETNSPDETRREGERLGRSLKPGDTVLLTGELGVGKTTFVQGMAKGLGVDEAVPVRSPSFALIHEYEGSCHVRHVDLYRIDKASELETVGLYDPGYECVTIIEWADKLPEKNGSIMVEIKELSETKREITVRVLQEPSR